MRERTQSAARSAPSRSRLCTIFLMTRVWVITILAGISFSAEWPQFRGPNGSGVGDARRLPSEFGPDKNVVWKSPVPLGYSSPVISGNLIFLTGIEGGAIAPVESEKDKLVHKGGRLYAMAIDRTTGKLAWRNEFLAPGLQLQTNNSAATPSPALTARTSSSISRTSAWYSYTRNGKERWRLPLGPFNNMNGAGSSPIVFRDLVYLVCDQDSVGGIFSAGGRQEYGQATVEDEPSGSHPKLHHARSVAAGERRAGTVPRPAPIRSHPTMPPPAKRRGGSPASAGIPKRCR